MGQVWFTSDEHFGHENIIKFCNRPFTNTDEMRNKIIENHNKLVKAGDRVYHLGDMFWRTTPDDEALSIRHALRGEHYYIFGNHDEVFHRSQDVRKSFVWCKDVFNLKIEGYPNVWLNHYAHRVWNGSHKGAYHLYGHTHAQLPQDGSLSFDVGVDANNFCPISIDQVRDRMNEIGKDFLGKCFICPKEGCGNKFVPFHSRPTICSKCGTDMELK